jgi:hypothetical protein
MIISNLNHLEVLVADAKVEGGLNASSSYLETDNIGITFNSNNNFSTSVSTPWSYGNSAAAGGKGDAINNTCFATSSYTKADTVAVTQFLGGSFSGSASVAVINPYC